MIAFNDASLPGPKDGSMVFLLESLQLVMYVTSEVSFSFKLFFSSTRAQFKRIG